MNPQDFLSGILSSMPGSVEGKAEMPFKGFKPSDFNKEGVGFSPADMMSLYDPTKEGPDEAALITQLRKMHKHIGGIIKQYEDGKNSGSDTGEGRQQGDSE